MALGTRLTKYTILKTMATLTNKMADAKLIETLNVGLVFCDSTDIFNILNQTDINYPRLSDPNYLLLLDTRKRKQYNESHILTAKFAPRDQTGSFVVPYEADLQTKQHCIVYDSRSDSFNDPRGSSAISCARLLWDMGSKNPVIVIKGGFDEFSALFPFLRTQKIIYTQMELDCIETFPIEIIPGLLYTGTIAQAQNAVINKALNVKAHVNVTTFQDAEFSDGGQGSTLFKSHIFQITVEDSNDADIYSYFQNAAEFIDNYKDHPGQSVLLCSVLNISRSITVAIAYLMWNNNWNLEKAYSHVKKCKTNMQPNRSFIKQLSQWEGKLYGKVLTDISEPDY